jgi:hypothetical protein
MPSDLMAGHQGRWTASHARVCMGRIIEYQIQRRDRTYVPGLQCHGRANDYRNMFLQELKEWILSYFTLENVKAEELKRRSNYLAKVKMDNFHWCFPNEGSYYGEHNFHDVVDFVHDKIKDALSILEREEKNRSMCDQIKVSLTLVTICSYCGCSGINEISLIPPLVCSFITSKIETLKIKIKPIACIQKYICRT